MVYSLPLFAFGLTAYLRFGNVWITGVKNAAPQYYLALLVFTEIIWIIAAHYYKLPSVADLFWEYTGIRAAFLACFVTLLSQTALLCVCKAARGVANFHLVQQRDYFHGSGDL